MSNREKFLDEISEKGMGEFVEYLLGNTRADFELNSVGSDIFRLNPSPCCQHNDCFSLRDNVPAYYCFSCGEKGSAIDLAKLLSEDYYFITYPDKSNGSENCTLLYLPTVNHYLCCCG